LEDVVVVVFDLVLPKLSWKRKVVFAAEFSTVCPPVVGAGCRTRPTKHWVLCQAEVQRHLPKLGEPAVRLAVLLLVS
jgi:hypothetical protein